MGDRCVIANKNKNIGVYLHWNGYREFVESALAYCDAKGYRSPDEDYEYGWARLCQVLGNTIGGTLSLGVGTYPTMDTDNWDNGTYIIKNWDICQRLYQHYPDEKIHDTMFENLQAINQRQPKSERLSDEELEKYAEAWEEKHLDRLKDDRKEIVLDRIKENLASDYVDFCYDNDIFEWNDEDIEDERQGIEPTTIENRVNSYIGLLDSKDRDSINEEIGYLEDVKESEDTNDELRKKVDSFISRFNNYMDLVGINDKSKESNKGQENNSTKFDKNGKDSTEVNEPVIPYSTLKKTGETIYLKGGGRDGR